MTSSVTIRPRLTETFALVTVSSALDTNDQYTMTFDRPGSYRYYCTLHPRMTGTVVVE